jgi:hypothetical protein
VTIRRLDQPPPSRARIALIALAVTALGMWHYGRQDRPGPPTVVEGSEPPAAPASAGDRRDAARPSAEAAGAERYDLAADEARGGHTLARHVGLTDAQLAARLAREPSIGAASTYTDLAAAERTVARTLMRERSRVDAWLARAGHRPNLALDYRGAVGETIGRTLRRGRRDAVSCVDAVVVLRWTSAGHFVLTSYPERRR